MNTETSISTEEAILVAARKVFESKGFDGARMQEISDRAGINRALLHYYFRSKDKMFERIFDEALERFMPLLSTWDQDPDESWELKTEKIYQDVHYFSQSEFDVIPAEGNHSKT